jgi:hypothetical protein
LAAEYVEAITVPLAESMTAPFRVDAQRGVIVGEVVSRLSCSADDAVSLLHAVCIDEDAPIGTRIRAGSEILTRLARWRGYEQSRTVGSADGARAQLDFVEALR